MYALEIEDLRKTYKNGLTALKGIDLRVRAGDFFALLGPNGAGKSTTIGIVTSLINKSAGRVSIFDIDIDENFPLAKSYIGVVPQEINCSLFERVVDIVLNQAGYYGIRRAEAMTRAKRYLTQLHLWDRRHEITRNLSGGMKRRLLIARALVHEPKLLILDEPTAGVDIEIRRLMWSFLSELNAAGTTIILTTHYLEEAERLCRNIAIIDKGEIIENTTMRGLLTKLHAETFVLDCEAPMGALPRSSEFEITRIDDHTIEVEIDKGKSLNDVFTLLSAHAVNVKSMRNKSNRLEELFINMVNGNV